MNDLENLPRAPDPPMLEMWESMVRNSSSEAAIALRYHALYCLGMGNMQWLEYVALAERVMHERCIRF